VTGRPRRWRRLGLRREVLILVPTSFFLAVVLSIGALLSSRNAVSLLIEERRAEAMTLGRRIAGELTGSPAPASRLQELALAARGVALLDGGGQVLATAGDLPDGPLLAPLRPGQDEALAAPRAFGPDRQVGDRVVALIPLGDRPGTANRAPRRWLRLDLGATVLAAQGRTLPLLTWLIVGIDGALAALVLLFLGHMLAPYESLLERARKLGSAPDEEEDEVAFLLGTFERALEGLSRPATGADDIAVLQRTLGVSLESGVLLLDQGGGVLALNETGAALLGIPRPEIGTPVERLGEEHPGLDVPFQLVAESVATGLAVRREECRVQVGDAELTLGLTVHPLRRDDGLLRGFLVLFVDLTEVRRQRERAQLTESLRQLGELAGGVAHELRNSLGSIKGYLTLIDRDTAAPPLPGEEPGHPPGQPLAPGVVDSLAEIRREADHLQRVLEDFLSFARPGSARLEPLDLRLVVERAAADPALEAATGGEGRPTIRIAHRGRAAGTTISGDPQLLERALRNLLHNAVQAGREAGDPRVDVTVDSRPQEVRVTVADRGPGIPPALRERLFQPFVSGKPGGVGLGLSLTHRILTLHGATLSLEDRDGGGTLVCAMFPATTDEQPAD